MLFVKYLKDNLKIICLLSAFAAIFATVLILFHVPITAFLYAFAICTAIALISFIFGFVRFSDKHKQLCLLRKAAEFSADSLPIPDNLIESDYQTFIKNAEQVRSELIDSIQNKYTSLTEYYTVWVHQIKTPIAAMRLILQSDDSEQSRELSYALQQIEQYAEMALCYVRLDSDSGDLVIKEYDLDGIIKQAIKKFASEFIRRKIKLQYTEVNCKVLTDEKWLLFIIEQLLSNSLKYTPSGSIKIYAENGQTLCVEDSGIGIAAEDLPRIFEKGFTGYNGREYKRSTGIGLYLCKRIAKMLGHTVTAQSEISKGTVMKIDLSRRNLKLE